MTSCQAQRKIYKKHICKIFTRTAENAQWSVERVKVRERHAKLLIWKEYSWKEEKSHELLSRKKKSLELINLEALFDLDEDGYVPQTVVLQGVSGIGKTTTAQKMLVGWASGELFQDMFEYVFYIHCRELKPLTGQEAVEDLILRSCGGERCISMSDVEAEPDKVLFIIDGFDALKIPTHVLSPDPAKPSLVDKTLVSLVRKDYLSGCSLIVTTRPAALETLLRWLQRAHWAEVPEFSEDEREEYFNTFFGNEQRGALGFKIVKENEVLFSMCSLPSVCWIVCVVIEQQMEDERCLQNALKTLTSVYLTFVSGVVRPPSCAGDQVLMNNTLKRLCALAAEGVHQQNTEFEEVDLTRHGLQAPALRALFLKDDIFTGSQGPCSLYSFRHLSLQEFFAALFYVLEAAEDAEMFDHKVTSLLGDFKEQKNHHLLRTVRFLFGLLRKEILFQMRTGLQWKNSPEVKPALLQWVRTETKDMSDNIGDQELALFHCMYEMQYDELRKSLLEKHKDFKFSASSFTRELGTADFRVLAFCFKDALGEIGFEKLK